MEYSDPFIEILIEGSSSVFRGLSPSDKEFLDSHHSYAVCKKGDFIVREGEKSRGFMILVSGKAKLFRIGAGKREQIIKMLRPQSVIIHRTLFKDNPYPFSSKALEDSAVVTLEKPALLKILKTNPETAVRFMKIMADELTCTYNRLISLTQKHVRGRLAESILLLRDTYGLEADSRTLRIMLPREDIAHLSSMTTANAIRTLSSFVAENIIEIERRKIILINPSKLEQISESGQ